MEIATLRQYKNIKFHFPFIFSTLHQLQKKLFPCLKYAFNFRRKSQCAGTVDPNQLMAEKFYPLYQPVVHRVPTEHFFIPVSHLFEVHSNQKLWLQHAQEQQQKVYATGTEPEPFLRTLFSVFSDAEMSKC